MPASQREPAEAEAAARAKLVALKPKITNCAAIETAAAGVPECLIASTFTWLAQRAI